MRDLLTRLRDHAGTAWKNEEEAAAEIERLRASNQLMRGLLETAVDAWECGLTVTDRHSKLLVGFRGACLPESWHDEAAKAAGGE